MGLNSDQLDAFFEVARCGSFSKAAETLAVSQPALSQRIKKLEDTLGATLFVREPSGLIRTDMAERLLLYCQTRRDLEAEFFHSAYSKEMSGIIRVAGFSSIMRSAIMPALSDLIREQPQLQIELVTRELNELPEMLKTAQSDFVITNQPVSSGSVESHLLGFEENVLIESAKTGVKIPDVILDHDTEDQAAFDFFKKQGRKKTDKLRRSFLDEVDSIIEGVELGWGRGVVARHLVEKNRKVRVVERFTPVKADVFLNFHTQPFYLPLHKRITSDLIGKVPLILNHSS